MTFSPVAGNSLGTLAPAYAVLLRPHKSIEIACVPCDQAILEDPFDSRLLQDALLSALVGTVGLRAAKGPALLLLGLVSFRSLQRASALERWVWALNQG